MRYRGEIKLCKFFAIFPYKPFRTRGYSLAGYVADIEIQFTAVV